MTRIEILAPLSGRVVPMEEVPDPVFSEFMLGDGLAIDPTDGLVLAPMSGSLVVFHSAGHAFAIEGPDSASVLVHVGLDTVGLKGAGFARLAEVGDEVVAGQPIVRMDVAAIVAAGLSPLSPVLLPQLDEGWTVTKTTAATVTAGRDVLITIER
jgi:sugar PTS system EIIA component